MGEQREQREEVGEFEWRRGGGGGYVWKRLSAVQKLSLPMGQVKGQGPDTEESQ